jgi:hypothetical protein
MEKTYWLGRKRSAMLMARSASSAEVRLIHYDLAGRYSIMAANALASMPPPTKAPAEDEQVSLHLPLAPAAAPGARSEAEARRDPATLWARNR